MICDVFEVGLAEKNKGSLYGISVLIEKDGSEDILEMCCRIYASWDF